MSDKETVDGNKLIAEFMEIKAVELSFTKNPKIIYLVSEEDRENYLEGFTHLGYNLTWDLLMPVVEKIEKLDGGAYGIYITPFGCEINDFSEHEKTIIETHQYPDEKGQKIYYVWQACVKFIKWRNQKIKV